MEIYRKIASGVADSLSVRNPIEIFKSTIDIPADVVVGDTLNLISAATFTVNNLKGSTVNAYAAIFNGPVLFKNGQSIDFNFTPGSIIFAGPSGVLSEDNANFYWDNTNKRLGLGVISGAPSNTLDVGISSAATPAGGAVKGISIHNYDISTSSMNGILNYFREDVGGAGARHSGAIVFGKSSSWVSGSGNYPAFMAFYTRPNAGDEIERVRIDANGNFGLNITNPTTRFHCADSIRVEKFILAGDSIVSLKTVYGVAGVIGALYGG